MFRKSSLSLLAACLMGALATQPAAAGVIFTSTTDTFGMNYNITPDIVGGLTRTSFGGNTNGAVNSEVHVEVFTGLGGTGSNVFSGGLDTLWNTDFTQTDMLDGIFSVVVSFTGAQLPLAGPPGTPPALLLSLTARGRDATVFNTSYRSEVSTFVPAATPATDLPEPQSVALVMGALAAAMAARRSKRAAA